MQAATCIVPSTNYPTVQSAVDVINCTEIVLASGTFFGNVAVGRSLELRGAGSDSTSVVGRVSVSGSSTKATFDGLKILSLAGILERGGFVVVDDAEVLPNDLVIGVFNLIFRDDFETGDLAEWSYRD